jgi:hypothetical protein
MNLFSKCVIQVKKHRDVDFIEARRAV